RENCGSKRTTTGSGTEPDLSEQLKDVLPATMIKRIPISALKVGMYISDLNNDWIPHNTQRRKGVIKREETIDKIRRMGVAFVYIDVTKGLDSQDSETASEVDRRNEQALQGAGAL